MGTVKVVEAKSRGQLANNGITVGMLQTALSRAETNTNTIPSLIKTLAAEQAWREFVFPDTPEETYRWNAADFRRFIESPRPKGCQTPLHLLERLLKGTDVYETFLDLTRGEPGNPTGNNQHTGGNCDTIIDSSSVDPPAPPPTGTSISYALRRLKRNRDDLYRRVLAGELSAHQAMIDAGFRLKQITIPADPRKAAKLIVRHFSRSQFSELVDEALDYYKNRQHRA